MSRTTLPPTTVFKPAALYPISTVYLAGVVVVWVAVTDRASVPVCCALFGIVAVFAVTWSAMRELRAVHRILDGQREELLHRVDDLIGQLRAEGLQVPRRSVAEQAARDDAVSHRKGRP